MIIIAITLLTFFASFIGTLSGFGTSTIMIPILIVFLPVPEVIFLVAIIHWFTNIWKIVLFRFGFDKRLLLLFGIPACFTSYIGAYFVFTTDREFLLQLLGLFLMFYAFFVAYNRKFKLEPHAFYAVLGGILSGLSSGIFGIGGAIRGTFLSAFNVPKATYIATLSAIGFIIDTTRIITYIVYETSMSTSLFIGLLLFIPISFLGVHVGKMVVNTIPQAHFRTVIALFLVIVGIKLLLWP
jgi:uncharacterized protein